MNYDPNGNPNYNQTEDNHAYTMLAVAKIAIWVESHLKFPGEPSDQRLINLDDLFEGKLPQPIDLPILERDPSSPLALQRLISLFDLEDTEVLVLLATLATELIPSFDRMCGAYNSSLERATPTFAMLASLFKMSRATGDSFDWRVIDSLSNLQRWKLIEVGEFQHLPRNQRPLTVDPSILHYLLGSDYHDPEILEVINYTHLEDFNSQFASRKTENAPPVEELATAYNRAVAEQYPVVFQLTGTDVTNKDNIASVVASSLGCGIIELDCFDLTTVPQQLARLATRLRRWQRIDGSLLIIKADRLRQDDHNKTDAVRKLINLLQTPVMISTIEPMDWGEVNTINTEVTVPDERDQVALWRRHLSFQLTAELDQKLPMLVSQFNLTAPAIKTIASRLYLDSSDTDSAFERLWNNCRVQARQKLDSLATRVSSKATWNNLILPDTVKSSLTDIVSQVGYKHLVYQQWGFTSNRGLGITALFSGVSGTGKTTAAEVIANELKLDLYKIELSTVISKYIGETEKNLRKIFDAAEAGGAILLFDEADALFGKRTEVKDSKDRHSNAEISYLLQKMEAYSGLAILTTNLPSAIDPAFKRRLRFVVDFAFPDVVAQERIWHQAFPSAAPTIGLDYQALAELNLTGGNIRSVAINAAFEAARDGEAIGMKHVVSAALSEAKKLGNSTHLLERMVLKLDLDLTGRVDGSKGETFGQTEQPPSPLIHKSSSPQPSNDVLKQTTSLAEKLPSTSPNKERRDWNPQKTYELAQKSFRQGRYSEGYELLKRGTKVNPRHSGLNFWMGFVVWEVKLDVPPTEVMAALERAETGDGQWLDHDEALAACWFLKAQILERFQLADAKTCQELYKRYLKAYPQGTYSQTAKSRRDGLAFEVTFGKPPD